MFVIKSVLLVPFFLSSTALAAVSVGIGEGRLYGVNYDIRIGPDWTTGDERCKTYDRIVEELTQLQQVTDNVRIYSMVDCNDADLMLRATAETNMGLWMGMWVGENKTNFEEERAELVKVLGNTSYDLSSVLGIHVSSESIYRKEISIDDAIMMRDDVKSVLTAAGLEGIPVTVSDIIDTNLANKTLITVDDQVVTFNQFPFWNNYTNINDAADYMLPLVQELEEAAGDRQIIVTETGWADAGFDKNSNFASPASMAKWLRDFVCLANENGWQYFWFNAYDSDWQRVNNGDPGSVEGHFGLFDVNATLKPHIANLRIDCTVDQTDIDPTQPVTPPPAMENATSAPSSVPTVAPSSVLSSTPSEIPSQVPTAIPSLTPVDETLAPTNSSSTTTSPTETKLGAPSSFETPPPTMTPTNVTNLTATPSPSAPKLEAPSSFETTAPAATPTTPPTAAPTMTPTMSTTITPTNATAETTESSAPTTTPSVTSYPNTSAPSASSNTTESPSQGPTPTISVTMPPTLMMTTAAPSSSPVDGTPEQDTATGSPTTAPFISQPAECALNEACALLNLEGDCCPTVDGWTLDCCRGVRPAEEQCSDNPKCNVLGLTGLCCPTVDEWLLDCCETVPDECQQNPDDCGLYSAEEYLAQQNAEVSSARNFSLRAVGATTTAMVGLLCFAIL